MENKKIKISVSIDKKFDEIMEKDSTNKSKLINTLLKKYLSDNQLDINIFKKKVA